MQYLIDDSLEQKLVKLGETSAQFWWIHFLDFNPNIDKLQIIMYEDSIQQTSIMCEKCRNGNDDIILVKEMSTLMDSLLVKLVICQIFKNSGVLVP